MSMLAYDPDRVRLLQGATVRALDGLRAVRCTDPAAVDAVRLVRSAAEQLESTWLPLVGRVLSTDPLTRAQRRAEHIDALDRSLIKVMAEGYGWLVQQDPLSDNTAVVTAEQARALGAMLNQIDLEALLDDPEQLRWLAERLEIIGRDPTLSSEFLSNFHEWAELCDRFGGRRALLLGDTGNGPTITTATTVDDLDAVLAGLAHTRRSYLRTASESGCVDASSVVPQMDEMNPYSAALIVQYLGLDAASLARVADRLLQRWRNMPWEQQHGRPPSDFSFSLGANTADILMQALLLAPGASAAFVALTVEHPEVLFGTATDPTLAHRVILDADRPGQRHRNPGPGHHRANPRVLRTPAIPARRGQRGLRRLVATVPRRPHLAVDHAVLGAEPRLEHRGSPQGSAARVRHRRRRSSRPPGHQRRGGQRRCDHHRGYRRQPHAGGVRGLLRPAHPIGAERPRPHCRAGVRRLADVARRRRRRRRIPFGRYQRRRQRGVARRRHLAAAGRPRTSRRRRGYAQEYMLTTAAAATVASVAGSWSSDGTLPPGFPPPPAPDPEADDPAMEYEGRFLSWVDLLPGGHDGELANRVTRLQSTFIGPASAGGSLAT